MVPGKSLNGDLCKESITHVTSCRYILQMDFVGLLRTCRKRESGLRLMVKLTPPSIV